MNRQIVLDVSEFQTPSQLDQILTDKTENIAGVYIKLTQDVSYRDDLAGIYAQICKTHGIPFGCYDYLGDSQIIDQANKFYSAELFLQPPTSLIPMLDCEKGYDKGQEGVDHWKQNYGDGFIIYSDYSDSYKYTTNKNRWVASYPDDISDVTFEAMIETYKQQGFKLWQYTNKYLGYNQDASILLIDSIDELRVGKNR